MATGKDIRSRPFAARRFRYDKTVAGSLRHVGPAVADLDGLIDQMIEILEGIFQPFDFGKGAGHVDTDLKKSIAKRDRHTELSGKPACTHHIRHLAVYV